MQISTASVNFWIDASPIQTRFILTEYQYVPDLLITSSLVRSSSTIIRPKGLVWFPTKQSKSPGVRGLTLAKARRRTLNRQTSSSNTDIDGLESACLSAEPCLYNFCTVGMCFCSCSHQTRQKPEPHQWLVRAPGGMELGRCPLSPATGPVTCCLLALALPVCSTAVCQILCIPIELKKK